MTRVRKICYQIPCLLLAFLWMSCHGRAQIATEKESNMKEQAELYLAGGCFWGTEHFLKQINGVLHTDVGYANGRGQNPSYEEVCTDQTGFAETVHVVYNPQILPISLLLQLYFRTIDPTSLNKQGGDVGTQYRTGIYYTDAHDFPLIQAEMAKLGTQYTKKLQIEVLPLRNFYAAEDYHQDYLDKNPSGYCHVPQALMAYARVANEDTTESSRYVKKTDDELKRLLTPLQYEVTQHAATERPYDNAYNDEFRPGIYVDITTGEPLFLSTDKFESGCGWPAFSKPIDPHFLEEKQDSSHGMQRIEVRSAKGQAHLGHVFKDGPKDRGGLRYCINSASLRFIPQEEMKAQGYEKYLILLKH